MPAIVHGYLFSLLFVACLVVTPSLGAVLLRESGPVAKVKNGTYYGTFSPSYQQDFFLGIPYAKAPVGDLRFRNPVSLNTTWSQARNATQYGPACYGYGSDTWLLGNPVSEDCLTLNVVRPAGVDSTISPKLPVAVWIHGGGFTMGSGRDPRYNLSFIVEQSVQINKPFIAISINYRLQAFGFLYGSTIQDAGVTNIGFRDQRLALHWIQENVAAFGGDPAKVTIWGESAGGASVGLQMLAYGGRDDGLFRSAIMQSGTPIRFSGYKNASIWDKYYNNITSATNCANYTDTLACLRTVPIDRLNAVLNSSTTASVPYWGPNLDGDFIIKRGSVQLLNGEFTKVPLLHGQNFDEGAAFAPKGINNTEQFLTLIQSQGPNSTTALTIAALYPDIPAIGIPATLTGAVPPTLGTQLKRVAAYTGDSMFHAPRRLTSQVWTSSGVPNYNYHFNVIVNGLPAWAGVAHFQEVAFVFNNINGEGYKTAITADPFAGKPETLKQLAQLMSRAWVAFIVDGDPNGSHIHNIRWPQYTLEDPENIVFDVNVTNLSYLEPDYYRAAGIKYIIDNLNSSYSR